VAFHPSGRFAFVAGDGVTALAVDPASGALGEVVGRSFPIDVPAVPSCTRDPRVLAVSSDGRLLYVIAGACVSTLGIDPASGSLELLAGSPLVLDQRADPYVLAASAGRLYYAIESHEGAQPRLVACFVDGGGLPLPSCFDAPTGDHTLALVPHPSGPFVYT